MNRNPAFEFKAEPTTLSSSYKPLYRPRFNNVMHDQHIIRGKTINNPKLTERLTDMAKRQLYRNETEEKFDPTEILTPRPPLGRSYAAVMTDPIYETLDVPTNFNNVKIQTDPALNVPITIKYNIRKTGVDSSTQVQEEDLKYVYNPKNLNTVVRVILNKVLEESRMEVLEENEFLAMQNAKNAFRQQKMKLLNQVQRIEQKEQRLKEEKQRRVVESRNATENTIMAHKKLVSRLFAKYVIGHTHKKTFAFFDNRDEFFERRYTDLHLKFVPSFLDSIEYSINRSNDVKTRLIETIDLLNAQVVNNHLLVVEERKTKMYQALMEKNDTMIDSRIKELNRNFSLPDDVSDFMDLRDKVKDIRRTNTLN